MMQSMNVSLPKVHDGEQESESCTAEVEGELLTVSSAIVKIQDELQKKVNRGKA